MTKFEYMSELEGLLLDISVEEREEALAYYNDYFEDAGPDNADRVIDELGSPQNVAEIIKSDLKYTDPYLTGEKIYTETGYKDMSVQEDRYEIAKDGEIAEKDSIVIEEEKTDFKEKAESTDQASNGATNQQTNTMHNEKDKGYGNKTKREEDWKNFKKNKAFRSDTSKILLIIILCIFAIPIGIPVISTIFALFVATIAVVCSLFLVFVILAIVFCFTGIVLIASGIYQMFIIPIEGVLVSGVGLLLLGAGLIFTMIVVWLCTKVIPVVFRGIVNLCKMPFRRRGVTG